MRTSLHLNKGFSYIDAIVAILAFAIFWVSAAGSMANLTAAAKKTSQESSACLEKYGKSSIENFLP